MASISDLTMTLPFMDPGETFSNARKQFHLGIGQGAVAQYDGAYEDSPIPAHLDMPGSPMMEAQPGGGDRYAAPAANEGAIAGAVTTGGTEEVHGGVAATTTGVATTATSAGAPAQKISWLGFTPRDHGANVRARKSSKKIRGIDGTI